MRDPYEILGVAKTASARSAPPTEAGQEAAPDLNPGDKQAEEQFKEVAAANDLLSDPESGDVRRRRGGRLGGGEGVPNARCYRGYATEGGGPYENQSAYGDFAQGDDLFAELLRRSAEQARRRPGADLHYELPVAFPRRCERRANTITLPQGGTMDVTIPAGVEDGQTPRLRGKGAPNPAEARPATRWCRSSSSRPLFHRRGRRHPVRFADQCEGGGAGGRSQNADDHGKRHAQNPEAIEHRRRVAPPRQGREDARPHGRRTGQARSDDADRGRART